jgi:predicted nucleic acid-binding protein
MRLLLHTEVCVHLIRDQPNAIVKRLTQFALGDIAISTVTLAELEYGVSKSGRLAKQGRAESVHQAASRRGFRSAGRRRLRTPARDPRKETSCASPS